MIRILNENDYVEAKKLVSQIHELHAKNRADIFYEDQEFFPVEYFNQVVKDQISLCYIDEKDNKMCGVLIASKKTQNKLPVFKKRRFYYIDDIVVDQTCRRRKIATKLYNYLKEVARKDQIDAILLNVWAFNKEAIKFYQSLGMNVQKMTFEYFLKK